MKEKKKFKIKNLFKSRVFFFVIGALIFGTIGVSASTLLSSGSVTYDNSSSGLSATNLQDALDELYEQASSCPVCDSEGNCTVTCPNGTTFKSTSTGYQCVPFNGTVYAFNTRTNVKIGTSTLTDLGTSYATFSEALASNSNSAGVIALKYTVKNNVLIEGYVCFISENDGNEYCLKYKDFANNVAILNTAFPDCGASASDSAAGCYDGSVGPYANSSGYVSAFASNGGWECVVDYGSYAYCYLMGE